MFEPIHSAEECQTKCQAHEGCRFFGYVPITAPQGYRLKCYLKSDNSNKVAKADRITGPKKCP